MSPVTFRSPSGNSRNSQRLTKIARLRSAAISVRRRRPEPGKFQTRLAPRPGPQFASCSGRVEPPGGRCRAGASLPPTRRVSVSLSEASTALELPHPPRKRVPPSTPKKLLPALFRWEQFGLRKEQKLCKMSKILKITHFRPPQPKIGSPDRRVLDDLPAMSTSAP